MFTTAKRRTLLFLAFLILGLAGCTDSNDTQNDSSSTPAVGADRTKPNTQPIAPPTQEKAAAIREILSRDFAALVAKEFQSLDPKATPYPRPGFQVQISSDFDVMMHGAPELDPKAPRFHEGNAAFFYEQLGKATTVGLELTSSSFQESLTEVLSFEGASAGLEGIKEAITRLQKIETNNRHDVFVKKFFAEYLDGNYQLGLVMEDLEKLQARVKRGDNASIGKLVNELRRYSDRVGALVYRPGIGPKEVAVRKSTWMALDKLANEVAAAARK